MASNFSHILIPRVKIFLSKILLVTFGMFQSFCNILVPKIIFRVSCLFLVKFTCIYSCSNFGSFAHFQLFHATFAHFRVCHATFAHFLKLAHFLYLHIFSVTLVSATVYPCAQFHGYTSLYTTFMHLHIFMVPTLDIVLSYLHIFPSETWVTRHSCTDNCCWIL